MEETQKQDKPTTREQIEFIKSVREELRTSGISNGAIIGKDKAEMLKAINENLIAVRNWNDSVAAVGEKIQEIVSTLEEAKKLIKEWHCFGMPSHLQARAWEIYDSQSPEMKLINAIITKYKKMEAHKND